MEGIGTKKCITKKVLINLSAYSISMYTNVNYMYIIRHKNHVATYMYLASRYNLHANTETRGAWIDPETGENIS